MKNKVIGRDNYLSIIRKYSETESVVNQAFLGVKGVGKTSLFQEYFTRTKCKELASTYKNLFVMTRLDSRKQGENLYQFLLDQVRNGLMIIPDQEEKLEIKEEMKDIDEFFETSDNRLNQYLSTLNEHGYDLIVIMDQFHTMARDTDIGKEQYDVLRSLNEQKLITFWVITDTDLMETCATEQFIASFFAQKFTSKVTIKPVDEKFRVEITDYFIEQKKANLSEREKEIVTTLAEGIPQLVPALIDIIVALNRDAQDFDIDYVARNAITHDSCTSLFDGWAAGLNNRQKRIILDSAMSEEGITEDDIDVDISNMAALADDVGRGLLHVCRDFDERSWKVSTGLFKHYIIDNASSFSDEGLALAMRPGSPGSVHTQQSAGPGMPQAAPAVTNIFNIGGDFIQNQTNNVVNIQNAVTELEDLYRLVHGGPDSIGIPALQNKLDNLPFHNDDWEDMTEEEQDESMDAFADSVFESNVFSANTLTEDQKNRFCLTDEILSRMSEHCRKQLICGIHIYDLIQLCIDKFGLDMSESESPRGILFARAFEKHLKDTVYPAVQMIDALASQKVFKSNQTYKNYPIDKTTIGMYCHLVSRGGKYFEKIVTIYPEFHGRDRKWFKDLSKKIDTIGDLRNKCCHSGTEFKGTDLGKMIHCIFEDDILEDLFIFDKVSEMEHSEIQSLLDQKGV